MVLRDSNIHSKLKLMTRILIIFSILIFCSCRNEPSKNVISEKKEKIVKQFGYTLNDYHVLRDTIKRGDSFGTILEKNNLYYPQIYNIVQKVKRVYDIRKVNVGKPYTILFSKDSLKLLGSFILKFLFLTITFFTLLYRIFLVKDFLTISTSGNSGI